MLSSNFQRGRGVQTKKPSVCVQVFTINDSITTFNIPYYFCTYLRMKAWTIYLRYSTCNDLLFAQLVLKNYCYGFRLKIGDEGKRVNDACSLYM